MQGLEQPGPIDHFLVGVLWMGSISIVLIIVSVAVRAFLDSMDSPEDNQ